MPSRRRVCAALALSAVAPGCTFLRDDGVAVILVNDSHETRDLSVTVEDPAGEDFEASATLANGSRQVYQNAIPYGEARTATLTARAGDERASREFAVDRALSAVQATIERDGSLAVVVKRDGEA